MTKQVMDSSYLSSLIEEMISGPLFHSGRKSLMVDEFVRRLREKAGLPREDHGKAAVNSDTNIVIRSLHRSAYSKPLEGLVEDMQIYGSWLASRLST